MSVAVDRVTFLASVHRLLLWSSLTCVAFPMQAVAEEGQWEEDLAAQSFTEGEYYYYEEEYGEGAYAEDAQYASSEQYEGQEQEPAEAPDAVASQPPARPARPPPPRPDRPVSLRLGEAVSGEASAPASVTSPREGGKPPTPGRPLRNMSLQLAVLDKCVHTQTHAPVPAVCSHARCAGRIGSLPRLVRTVCSRSLASCTSSATTYPPSHPRSHALSHSPCST